MLTAIIDLLDGAKYLWEGDCHENQSLPVRYVQIYYGPPLIVNTSENSILIIRSKECNYCVIFDDPNNIVYLYQLAEDSPLTYAKHALKDYGLKDYVDAINKFN